MTNTMIYSELGGITTATIEFVCSHSGGYRLTTDLDLSGRGIKQTGDGTDHKRNKKTYHVTENAFNKLKEKYDTCFMALL